jgi:prepilin-type N-terminal cleavage/methylation domain-containing protein
MQKSRGPRGGYTLVELIVALLLFAIGGLALASTSAVIGRALNVDALREQSARMASRRMEILLASCHDATSGNEIVPPVSSEWTVARPAAGHIESARR